MYLWSWRRLCNTCRTIGTESATPSGRSAVPVFCSRENVGSPTYLATAVVRKLFGKLTELFYCLSASDLGLPNCIIVPAILSARGC